MMAHGVEAMSDHANSLKMVQSVHHQTLNHQQAMQQPVSQSGRKNVGVMGSRRIFAATFKLKVLDSYRNDIDCRGNQRATARKYGIHRRQIQKWLQCEENLRSSCAESNATTTVTSSGCCAVPIGVGSVLSTSPGPNNCQLDVIMKTEVSSGTLSSNSPGFVNSNNNSPGVNCNVSSGSPGTSHGAPAATVAPALNLSLARLHGDELAARHSPPHHPTGGGAPMRHSIRRCSSPTSLQYLQHSSSNNANSNNNNINNVNNNQVPSSSPTAPLRGMHVCYDKYASHQDTLSQNHQRHQRRQHQPIEIHDSQNNPSDSPERKYFYGINRPSNFEQRDAILSRNINADGYYESLESYRKGFVDFGNVNNNNNNVKEVGKVELYCQKNGMDEVGKSARAELTENAKAPSYAPASSLLVLHATAIKSERASPDSLATTAPCETPGSPESASLMTKHSGHHHNNNNNDNNQRTNQLACRLAVSSSETCNNGNHVDVCNGTSARNNNLANVTSSVANTTMGANAAIATAATVAVHSNETTTSPLVEHVHVSVDSHAFATRDSEKRPQGRERQQQQQQQQQHRHGDTIKVEYEEGARGGRRVKEEIVERDEVKTASSPETPRMMMMMMMTTGETKREMPEEIDDSTYHRDSTIGDYREMTRIKSDSSSGDSSGHTSPIVRESVGSYSVLSSPRAASSSGISTSSSCSDSEIDPLDYSSGTTRNIITDLSRRRSFSLRFKLDVLDAFHSDIAVAGNQRATARKFGINRRQVQKWLGQENDLRGEIALRGGDLRQRLGPMPEINEESTLAVDLRTSSMTTATISGRRSETELKNSSPPLYCCDIGSSSRRNVYYRNPSLAESPEVPSSCNLACCADNYVGSSMICYQDSLSQRRSSSGYPESQGSLYCYSPRDPLDNEVIDVPMSSSPLKRSACNLTCCYEMLPSPKRICVDNVDEPLAGQEQPPQDVPLCLVKPKGSYDLSPMHTEPVTSTVPTPPVVAPLAPTPASKKDAILFKPYLDNPISKPTEDIQLSHHQPNHRGLSPLSAQSVIVNNNNNCHAICNLNEERTVISQHDYALELSLRVPVSWRAQHSSYGEFPERLGSAFVRYPTSPHYT